MILPSQLIMNNKGVWLFVCGFQDHLVTFEEMSRKNKKENKIEVFRQRRSLNCS